jgi:hypothetical protein
MLNQAVLAASSSGLIVTARRREAPASARRFCSLRYAQIETLGREPRAQFENAPQRRVGLGVAPETQERVSSLAPRKGVHDRKRQR